MLNEMEELKDADAVYKSDSGKSKPILAPITGHDFAHNSVDPLGSSKAVHQKRDIGASR
jgi:hypothetical protein